MEGERAPPPGLGGAGCIEGRKAEALMVPGEAACSREWCLHDQGTEWRVVTALGSSCRRE